MRISLCLMLGAAVLPMTGSCSPVAPEFMELPPQTRLAFMNFSIRYYAALGMRKHAADSSPGEFTLTPLLPPGAVFRADLLDFVDEACPKSIDFRLFMYRRVNDGADPPVPIGLDPGEQVDPVPIVAGQIDDIPGACGGFRPLGVYTIVNWDAPAGVARVKFAQDSEVDALIRSSGRFPNHDAVWELTGVEPPLAGVSPPPPMAKDRIAGRVTRADGNGVEGIGVLLRTRFQVRLGDLDSSNDPDLGYSDPIAYSITDASGGFSFDRPAGVYEVEFFSDDFLFAPSAVDVETPLETIWVLAEPL